MNSKFILVGAMLAVSLATAPLSLADEPAASTAPAAEAPAAPASAAPAPAPAAAPSAAAPAADPAAPPAATPAAPPAAAGQGGTADTGTVIFFRPSRFVGGAIGFIVREGDKELGKLRNGKYFSLHVAPGKHSFVVHSEAKDVLTIEVDAGETYYIVGAVGVGFVAGRPNLALSDQATFEAAKDKMKEVPPMSDKD